MGKFHNLLTKIKNIFNSSYANYSVDIALRYLPVVEEINKEKNKTKILEVGSGSLGITPYLKRRVDGVDINFNGPKSTLLKKIYASATKIPFENKSYDYVISIDLLEHLDEKSRALAINEMKRVARKKIFLGFPSGEHAEKEDIYAEGLFLKVMKYHDKYLRQHLKNGLPKLEEITKLFKGYNTRVLKNVNIILHRLIINMQFSKSRIKNFVSSVVFVLLLPLFKYLNFGKCYRYILIIEVES